MPPAADTSRGGLTLSQMMTYYVCVTALSIVITPHPEWETAMQIRDGKLTAFVVRPIGYFGYRLAQETSYQIMKSLMMLPSLAVIIWIFHEDLQFPAFDAARWSLFLFSALLAYALLTQIKFLLGISAFWIAEPGGFLELWHTLLAVLGGRLLPLGELPNWVQNIALYTPFSSLYSFPVGIFLGTLPAEQPTTRFSHADFMDCRFVMGRARHMAARFIGLRGIRRLKEVAGYQMRDVCCAEYFASSI